MRSGGDCSGALPVLDEHVIIKSVLGGRPVTQVAPVVQLHGLPEDVGTGVPVHLRTQDTGHRLSERARGRASQIELASACVFKGMDNGTQGRVCLEGNGPLVPTEKRLFF